VNIEAALVEALALSIMEATREDFAITSTTPVGGGSLHATYGLAGDTAAGKRKYFAKLGDAGRGPMLDAEVAGLRALAHAGALRVPRTIARGAHEETHWIVLEWLDLAPLDAASGARLGEALAAQHRVPQEHFGWAKDNWIGSSPQVNGWSDDWLAFWREKRLHAQLRYAAHNKLPTRMIDRGMRLMADCEAFFKGRAIVPSLLHGDLWAGNAAACGEGAVAFDPAVYCGDHEADIAMTELFGGFPKDFHGAYRMHWPKEDDYPVRRDFYNLYHVLNHANLFGASYIDDSEKRIGRLLAELG
jgi:fructosamine-3-kinase